MRIKPMQKNGNYKNLFILAMLSCYGTEGSQGIVTHVLLCNHGIMYCTYVSVHSYIVALSLELPDEQLVLVLQIDGVIVSRLVDGFPLKTIKNNVLCNDKELLE